MNINLGQYGKLITAVAGLAITLLTQKYASTTGAADWLPYVVGVASALGVYGVPNAPSTKTLQVQGTIEQTLPLRLSNAQLTDAEVAEIRKKFEELYPVQTLPASQAPASQAGSPPAATEGAKGN
jgi:hypothetical protein